MTNFEVQVMLFFGSMDKLNEEKKEIPDKKEQQHKKPNPLCFYLASWSNYEKFSLFIRYCTIISFSIGKRNPMVKFTGTASKPEKSDCLVQHRINFTI